MEGLDGADSATPQRRVLDAAGAVQVLRPNIGISQAAGGISVSDNAARNSTDLGISTHAPGLHATWGFKVNDGANTQSITQAAGATTIGWTVEEWDSVSAFNLTTDQWTVPETAKYMFGFQLEVDSSTHNNRVDVRIMGGALGTTVRHSQRAVLHAVTGGHHVSSAPILLDCAANDLISLNVICQDETVIFKGTAAQSWFWGHEVGN
jgi:hypothetical protein